MRVSSGKTIYKIKERQIVYDVFIIPYIKYGILASKGAPKAHLNKRSGNLKKAVTVMMFKNKHESTKPLLEYLSIVAFDLNIKLNRKTAREVYETIIV